MKKILITSILFFGAICFASAQTRDRLTDKEVKKLIENIEEGRDRFEDALDDTMKRALYRGPRGEVDIAQYLDDFQENVKNLKDRFTKDYSASSEATVVLQNAADIDNFIKNHPGIKGASEWERFAVDLRSLAGAYRTSLPLPEGSLVRRINDAEAAMTANSLAKQANQLKDEIGQDKNLPKEQKESYKQDVEQFIKQAKTLKSRISDSKPATVEARSLMDLAARIDQSLQAGQMSAAVTSAWSAMQPGLQKLEAAFGMDASEGDN